MGNGFAINNLVLEDVLLFVGCVHSTNMVDDLAKVLALRLPSELVKEMRCTTIVSVGLFAFLHLGDYEKTLEVGSKGTRTFYIGSKALMEVDYTRFVFSKRDTVLVSSENLLAAALEARPEGRPTFLRLVK